MVRHLGGGRPPDGWTRRLATCTEKSLAFAGTTGVEQRGPRESAVPTQSLDESFTRCPSPPTIMRNSNARWRGLAMRTARWPRHSSNGPRTPTLPDSTMSNSTYERLNRSWTEAQPWLYDPRVLPTEEAP